MSMHGQFPAASGNAPKSIYYDQGKFGRLFPTLPAFAADTPSVRSALQELGKVGGIMDAKDANDPQADSALAAKLITDARLRRNNPDNPKQTAGMTFLGQFLDHDMTFDPTSSLERQSDPEAVQNFRTPLLELDSLYGSGPGASPHLYERGDKTRLLVEEIPDCVAHSADGTMRYDVPRNSQGVAILGDPRNDENMIVNQLHLGLLKFHNAVVEHVREHVGLSTPDEVFAEAQRLVRWHYQWIILHEYLPKIVGQAMVTDILRNGRKFYNWRNEPFIPVEFSAAAFRFGHSQVRPSYRVNFGPEPGVADSEVFKLIFRKGAAEADDPEDMRGGKRAPRRFIDWQTFFDFGDKRARNNKKIDTRLSSVLMQLPSHPDGRDSLASLNLLRGLVFSLPSGQDVARAMNVKPLPASALKDLKPYHFEERTPLWFYVLREAEKLHKGEHLGPVGGRIVAEVFIGLLQGDSMSYLRRDPAWKPTLPGKKRGDFTIADLLTYAGVVAPM